MNDTNKMENNVVEQVSSEFDDENTKDQEDYIDDKREELKSSLMEWVDSVTENQSTAIALNRLRSIDSVAKVMTDNTLLTKYLLNLGSSAKVVLRETLYNIDDNGNPVTVNREIPVLSDAGYSMEQICHIHHLIAKTIIDSIEKQKQKDSAISLLEDKIKFQESKIAKIEAEKIEIVAKMSAMPMTVFENPYVLAFLSGKDEFVITCLNSKGKSGFISMNGDKFTTTIHKNKARRWATKEEATNSMEKASDSLFIKFTSLEEGKRKLDEMSKTFFNSLKVIQLKKKHFRYLTIEQGVAQFTNMVEKAQTFKTLTQANSFLHDILSNPSNHAASQAHLAKPYSVNLIERNETTSEWLQKMEKARLHFFNFESEKDSKKSISKSRKK